MMKKHIRHYLPLATIMLTTALPFSAAMAADQQAAQDSEKPTMIHNDSPTSADESTWQRPSAQELKKRLTPEQYHVTRENGTERPYGNAWWDNHEDGIYVDIVSGEPLFSSRDKFDSGTGWPSFTKPLQSSSIVEKSDKSFFMDRIEVRSKQADSHLGHVFNDGPQPTGLRYCINSASLRFIPAADLKKEGYGEYASEFKEVR